MKKRIRTKIQEIKDWVYVAVLAIIQVWLLYILFNDLPWKSIFKFMGFCFLLIIAGIYSYLNNDDGGGRRP